MATQQLPLVDAQQPSLVRKLVRKIHAYQFLLMALFMAMFGFLLIAFGKDWSHGEIWRDFGIALLTAGTLGLGIEFFTRRQFEMLIGDRIKDAIESCQKLKDIEKLLILANELTALGLMKYHPSRSGIDFDKFLKEADPGSEIRLLGISMTTFANDQMQRLLREKLEQGCTIKLLILDPESHFVELRAKEEKERNPKQLRKVIEAADTWHRDFIEESKNIALGYYDSAPNYFIVSTNTAMIIGFYLRGGRGGRFLHLELEAKEGGAYGQFQKHFDSLWDVRKEAQVNQSREAFNGADAQRED